MFLNMLLDISPGTHSSGLSVMLLLGVVVKKGNTGKCRSECEKIGTDGVLDSSANETKAQFSDLYPYSAGRRHVKSGLSTESFH